MENQENPLQMKNALYLQYINLIEEAYNLSQTDHEQSDIMSFEADKIRHRLNELEYVSN